MSPHIISNPLNIKLMKKFILFLLCASSLYAQSFDAKKIDSLFNTMDMNHEAMGGISIASEGNEVYKNYFGFSNLELKQKNNKETKHRIGSITKTFTATLIMQLVDEGKLKLDTRLSKFFPSIPNAKKISIEDLMRHRSGLYNVTNDDDIRSWVVHPQTREKMLGRFVENGVDFEPKTKTQYSNTNFILLSYIIEDIDNKTYQEALNSRIINPLKLERTLFGQEIALNKNEAFSYSKETEGWELIDVQTHLSAPMGAGAIVSTPRELCIFYESLFNGGLVSKASLEKMMTIEENMGMGMTQLVFKGLEVYGHDGGIDGFQSFALYIPQKRTSIAIALNGVDVLLMPIVIKALELYFENDPELKSESKIELDTKDLDVYLGTYSGETFPAKVVFTKEGNVLIAQATGQPAFKLMAVDKNIFKYDAMGISFAFDLENNTMLLNFGGKKHTLDKE
ncbi:MAG: D-alanyl-D-alanine carboxypeptidase [Flavobacteriaceae bacterium]|jgi:D-alanyl-D-alanine carboxypeptidase